MAHVSTNAGRASLCAYACMCPKGHMHATRLRVDQGERCSRHACIYAGGREVCHWHRCSSRPVLAPLESVVDARPAERGAAGARLRLKPQLQRQPPPQLQPQLRRQPLHQPRLPDTPACSRRARTGVVRASASASAFTSALASASASAFAAAAALASTARPRPQSRRSKHAEQFHVLLRTVPLPEVPSGCCRCAPPAQAATSAPASTSASASISASASASTPRHPSAFAHTACRTLVVVAKSDATIEMND